MYSFKTRLGSHLYHKLPRVYRLNDETTDYTLARFLDALGQGLDYTYTSTEEILKLLDVERMDARFLPFYAKMFGITYENDVPEEFQRKFLANLVEILKKKGTKEVIEFIAREITGMEAEVREAHHFTFRTWGTNQHEEMLGGFSTPKTFDSSQDFIYYLGGDSKTSRYTAYVTLYTEQDIEDVDIREELIRRYCEGLKPSYTTLIFRVRGVSVEEEFVYPSILESHKDLYNFGDVKQSNIQALNDYAIIKTKDIETVPRLNIADTLLNESPSTMESEYVVMSILDIDTLNIDEEAFFDTANTTIVEEYYQNQQEEPHLESKASRVSEQGKDRAICTLSSGIQVNIVDVSEDIIKDLTPSPVKTPTKRRKK